MRLRMLDALRGVAVLLVLCRHLERPPEALPAPLRLVEALLHRAGWIGVDLFFVLSGFLVSGLLFAEFRQHGTLAPARFIARRTLKIYPGFYVLLAASALGAGAAGPWTPAITVALATEAAYLQNYGLPFWNHTWSLAVEEHFYLTLPLLLLVLARLRPGHRDPFAPLLWGIPAACVAVLAMRCWLVEWDQASKAYHVVQTHLRVDGLLWGVLLGYGYHFRRDALLAWVRAHRADLVALVALGCLPAAVLDLEDSRMLATVGLATIAVGFTALVALSLDAGADGRARTLLRHVGTHSYAIYLWHMPVLVWLVQPLAARGAFALGSPTLGFAAQAATFFAFSIALGVGMTHAVERPFLALRERIVPGGASARTPRIAGDAAGGRDVVGHPAA